MIRIVVGLLCCGLLVGASPSIAQEARGKDSPPPVPQGVKFCPDLTYCKIKDRALQLDLAYPAVGKGPFPVVVFIHGSGSGAKGRKFNVPQVFELAQKGFVAVSISYRHLSTDPFPGAIHDVKCSIRWLRAHAADYKIDPDQIGVVGFSGGGSLALMLALAPEDVEFEGKGGHPEQSSRVHAVVSYFAPTDLIQLASRKPNGFWELAASVVINKELCTWMGGDHKEKCKLYEKASPITHAKKAAPPILLLHGGADFVVPPAQSRLFNTKMIQLGASIELMVFENAPHDFDEDLNSFAGRTARRSSHDFLESHLKPRLVVKAK